MTRDDLYSLPDDGLLARVIWGEARGEGPRGMKAVAWVVRNRVDADLGNDGKPDWWGEGYSNVVLKPFQFSCLNRNDPNLDKILHFDERNAFDKAIAKDIAKQVISAPRSEDPTGGATHYHVKSITPAWADKLTKTVTIGNHVFYK